MSGCTNRVICTQMWGLSACGTNPAQQAGLESESPRLQPGGTCVGLPVCANFARRRSATKQMLSGRLASVRKVEGVLFPISSSHRIFPSPPLCGSHPVFTQ